MTSAPHLSLVDGERAPEPPANIEIEQALLGAILTRNTLYDDVADFLKPQQFYQAVHGEIFEACATLIGRGQSANAVTLKNLFEQAEELPGVGGAEYLAKLQASPLSLRPADVKHYASTIVDMANRRGLIDIAAEMNRAAHDIDLDTTAEQIADKSDAALLEMRSTADVGEGLRSTGSFGALEEIEDNRRRRDDGQTIGLSTGLICLDRVLVGLQAGDLIILAGRPSMGKTALVTGIAHAVACNGASVGFFSREMSGKQISARLLALRTGLDFSRIRQGHLSDDELERLCGAQSELNALPLTIDDNRRANTISGIRAAARRHKRAHGLDLVVIDYLQLLQHNERTYRDNRQQEVSAISRDAKMMAGDLDVPVIAISQLSRANENRDDKRPQLQDLRESGAIEQDADVVAFVHRQEYYLLRDEPKERKANESKEKYDSRYIDWQARVAAAGGKAEIIVAKQRQGAVTSVTTDFHAQTMSFRDEGYPQGSML